LGPGSVCVELETGHAIFSGVDDMMTNLADFSGVDDLKTNLADLQESMI
jgi:hypothetical protein